MSDYIYKIEQYLFPLIKDIDKPNIVEFGVENGRSTKRFLEICRKNNGKLVSVDITDCKNLFHDSNWTFINSRDDNFKLLDKKIPKKVDIFFLDSVHEAKHVEKIIYHYYDKLSVGGFFFIDDISFLPYLKSAPRNSFYCEINNYETYLKILEIYNSNSKSFDLNFSFVSSGLAILKKIENIKLKKSIPFTTRTLSLKNIFRRIWMKLKKN